MVYGAILSRGERFYTYLSRVLRAIGNRQTEYNWLITDCQCYPRTAEIGALLGERYCWMSGDELTALVEREDFQWIWAVLSGFPKEVSLEQVLEHPLPYADGYAGFWKNPLTLQHPLAEVELVPWDSSATLVLSTRKELVEDYRRFSPLSEDLAQYNAQLR